MTVDLSKAQKGSKVKFRCGGRAVVALVEETLHVQWRLRFEGSPIHFGYSQKGHYLCGNTNPFDIIEITPPEFDWSTVKWGQAFKDEDGVWIYIGPSKDKGELIFEHTLGDFGPTCVRLSYAQEYKTRVPEHDMEVE